MSKDLTVTTTRALWHSIGYRYEVDVDGEGMVRVRYFDQPDDKEPGQTLTIPESDVAKLAEVLALYALKEGETP